MNRGGATEKVFIQKLNEVVENNLKNETFGVTELAKQMGVSRSSLYLKVKSNTQKSVSRFICEVRLKKAYILIKEGSLNVSEIAYEVGFNSPSYFIKCFHEYYGFSPGEELNKFIAQKNEGRNLSTEKQIQNNRGYKQRKTNIFSFKQLLIDKRVFLSLLVTAILLFLGLIIYYIFFSFF